MTGRKMADVVFCIDASSSMAPCFQKVAQHLGAFMSGLHSDPQTHWNVRLDLVAHAATVSGPRGESFSFSVTTVQTRNTKTLDAVYRSDGSKLFTIDIEAFRRTLGTVVVRGDETPLVALDVALDFPWRSEAECHRVVVFLTDEPLETSLTPQRFTPRVPELIRKLMEQRVLLFLTTPDSAGYEELATADRCEWEVTGQGNGLANVDFKKLLQAIGKSISLSAARQAPQSKAAALFGQDRWVDGGATVFQGA